MKQKFKKVVTTISFMLITIKTKVLANGVSLIQSTKLFTGTQRLANDLTTALLYILPTVSAGMFIYCQVMKNSTEQDEQRIWKKRQTWILGGLALGETAVGLINAFVGYYQ